MTREVLESDWKVFREVRDVALERFCKSAVDAIDRAHQDEARSNLERYDEISRLIRDRDKELARVFINPRRSTMQLQLMMLHVLGLLEPEELARFTPEVREHIQSYSKE